MKFKELKKEINDLRDEIFIKKRINTEEDNHYFFVTSYAKEPLENRINSLEEKINLLFKYLKIEIKYQEEKNIIVKSKNKSRN
jgi:hypothetical protein